MPPLDPTLCYRAVQSRDARFDGRFFTAVHTTGIYCRPICPARTPKFGNVSFYACAAAAEEAGFRACLRCRPEAAPGSAAWVGTCAVVARALRLIERGALNEDGIEALAAQVGLSDRHLRRLFERHLGASPVRIARQHRLSMAKKLLEETELPMGQLAFAAGFSSVRRFNAEIKNSFGASPAQLRKKKRTSGFSLRLPYQAPLDWPRLVAFLAPRMLRGVESIDLQSYRRHLPKGQLIVRPAQGCLRMELQGEPLGEGSGGGLLDLIFRVRALFDLGASPAVIAAHFAEDPLLGTRVQAAPGLRVPGAFDGFEVAVRALLGQQVSVAAASTVAGRLVERLGERACSDGRLFPRPERIARARVSTLCALGLPGARARALRELAGAVGQGLDLRPHADPARAREALLKISGIGAWTASYVSMRVFSEPDAFLSTDLVLRKKTELNARELSLRAEAWRPWRSYAAMYLWSVTDDDPSDSNFIPGR